MFNFPNSISGWEGLGTTFRLGYELIPLQEHTMPSTDFALSVIIIAGLLLNSSTAWFHSMQEQLPALGQMGPEDTFHSW